METEHPAAETPPKKKKRHILRKIFKYAALLLLLIIFSICGVLFWICQTQSGQNWLLETANKLLKPAPDKPGLQFILTSLSGSLPVSFRFGIEARDADGLWLSAPENSFNLNWHELPGKVHIKELKIANADLSRFPNLPDEKKESPPSEPFTIKDFQNLLASAGDFLYEKHWWMPDLLIEGTALENFLFPSSLLQEIDKASTRPVANSQFNINFIDQKASLKGSASISSSDGSDLKLPSISLKNAILDLSASITPNSSQQKLAALAAIKLNAEKPQLELEDFSANFLGNEVALDLELAANAFTNTQNPALEISINGPLLKAGSLSSNGNLSWKSGQSWEKGELDGLQKTRLNLEYDPPDPAWLKSHPSSPLAMLANPAKLAIQSTGDLPQADLLLDLATSGISISEKEISDIHFLVKSPSLVLPLDSHAWKALLDEHHLDLDLHAIAENIPVNFQTELFFQGRAENDKNGTQEPGGIEDIKEWFAGLRKLVLKAGGIEGSGNVSCLLAGSEKPELNGKLNFNVGNWQAINKFLPDMDLSGKLGLDLELATSNSRNSPPASKGTSLDLPASKTQAQNAIINLDIPDLALAMGKDKYSLSNLVARINIEDLFEKLNFNTEFRAASLKAEGFNLSLQANAAGQLEGPINASLQTGGNIVSKLDATWRPGEATVRKLDIDMNLPPNLSPSGKAARVGLHSGQTIAISYGEQKLNAQGIDLAITPSGRLEAHANLSSEKLDCKMRLDNFNFKPWQALVSQLPSGSASLQANLSGSPKKPSGNFQLNVNKVVVPGAALPPISLLLKGNIENRGPASLLNVALNLDQATMKTLGGTVGNVSASLPLSFGPDGVPKPNMDGNINAKVRWDGALGPLWNLVPLADMRLNGRLNINIDADGKLKAPHVRGGININKARFEEVALGVLLTDINLKLDLKDRLPGEKTAPGNASFQLPGGAQLAFSASDGRGGKMSIDGHAGLTGNDLNINAKIDHLKPLRRRDVHIELSGNASVRGAAAAPVIAGEIIVNKGEVLLNNLEMTGSVTTLPITEPGQAAKKKEAAANSAETDSTTPQGSGSLDVRVRMLPRFTVEGRGLTSIWQANLLIQGTPQDPRITGDISSVKGNFDFLGKNFALTKGVVFFGGGLVSNPLLDIDLTNETPDLTAHLLITGPVSKIKLSMKSDPSLPHDEILSRVLFGRSVGDLSRMEALQLAAAVAQLAGFGGGTGILGMAKKALGVDVLRLGTSSSNAAGDPGDQTAGGTTIEMGKYINDMIYMGVQQGMQPDSTAFIIQMELTPRTNLEIRTEQNNTWGGLQWKYNY